VGQKIIRLEMIVGSYEESRRIHAVDAAMAQKGESKVRLLQKLRQSNSEVARSVAIYR
jgi:hypothetical protein